MEKVTKVTVGLCVKNAESIIEEAVNSILHQNYPYERMELIVVDGSSKDRTLEILEKTMKRTDIKYEIFSENEGLGVARQIVVDNAHGDYIVWVDADMLLSKDFINKQVQFMDLNQRVGIAKGKYGLLDGSTTVSVLENIGFVVDGLDDADSLALGTYGCIYRTKAIRQVGGFDTTIKGVGEDQDAEFRVRSGGWTTLRSDAVFFEKRRDTLHDLWKEYFWHGYGGGYLFQKNRKMIKLYKFLFPVAIFLEFLKSIKAYKLTGQKIMFLLPIEYIFKRTAWLLGFVKRRQEGF